MRRTLESVAAQRLNKLGGDPQMVCSRADDIDTVNQIIMLGSSDNNDAGTSDKNREDGDREKRQKDCHGELASGCGRARVKIKRKMVKCATHEEKDKKRTPSVQIQVVLILFQQLFPKYFFRIGSFTFNFNYF